MSNAEGGSSAGKDGQPKTLSELNFHPHFASGQTGDAILQADDDEKRCFYFRLASLAELSSFFSGLPPPSPDDMVEGRPLIPLHGTSSVGLHYALAATRSVAEPAIFNLPPSSIAGQTVPGHIRGVVGAAVLASRYDLPVIYRVLIEGIQGDPTLDRFPFLHFAIWALSGIPSKISEAGEETVDEDITKIARPIASALRQHASGSWVKLQDLHLRRSCWLKRFHAQQVGPIQGGCYNCISSGHVDFEKDVKRRFKAVATLEELYDLQEQGYGVKVECADCAAAFEEDYGAKMSWIRDFSSKYDFDADYEDYLET